MTETQDSERPDLRSFLESVRGGANDEVAMAFVDGVEAQGFELYPAQEQAILELMSDHHVILSTPTGSGKSLVAFALVFRAIAQNRRLFYTAPIKALVSEKFFQLCEEVGADHVGMMTGDASVNRDAPVICCTAEILANMSLSPPDEVPLDFVVMDEFHYYGDRDRGVAWQLPLIARPDAQFLLMSATLGDTREIESSLRELSSRDVVRVHSGERPVPLEYKYVETPIHETITELLREGKAPIYLVNFTQREAAEHTQNIMSLDVASKEQKKSIAEGLRHFRFDSPYGRDMQRFLRHGLGLHHAGLLPKYRRVVEQLAQRGLLRIVSGTDTLGVGINIPIRTVLFTRLFKYDGEKIAILSVRDFQQIAGRAGRKGFDDAGDVVCEAPEHVIENRKMAIKIAANPQKKKKLVKKKPPDRNFVNWNETTFRQLIERAPEPLQSRFAVNHAMLLQTLQSHPPTAGYRRVIELIQRSHENDAEKKRHRRRCRDMFRSLRDASIVELITLEAKSRSGRGGRGVVVNDALQRDFSMNHTLSLYLVEAIEELDPDQDDYPNDVLTLVESILDHPRMILAKQVDKRKGELLAELKAAGIEYEQRMEELEKVEPPKPRAEFVYETFNAFAAQHPWLMHENIKPKSIARDLFERCMSFREYVKEYGLQRSEGLLLRYLSDAYRTLVQTVPERLKDERVDELVVYLRTVLDTVDNSLVSEWEALVSPDQPEERSKERTEISFDPRRDRKRFLSRIRAEMHQALRALATRDYVAASAHFRDGGDDAYVDTITEAMDAFFSEYEQLDFGPIARQTDKTVIREERPGEWSVMQTLVDNREDLTWAIFGQVQVDAEFRVDQPLVEFVRIGT